MNHFRLAWCTSQGELWRISQPLSWVEATIACFHMNNDAGSKKLFKIVLNVPELRLIYEAGMDFVAPLVPLDAVECGT